MRIIIYALCSSVSVCACVSIYLHLGWQSIWGRLQTNLWHSSFSHFSRLSQLFDFHSLVSSSSLSRSLSFSLFLFGRGKCPTGEHHIPLARSLSLRNTIQKQSPPNTFHDRRINSLFCQRKNVPNSTEIEEKSTKRDAHTHTHTH